MSFLDKYLDREFSDIPTVQLLYDMKHLLDKVNQHTVDSDDYDLMTAIITELKKRHQKVEHLYAREDYESENVGRDMYG